VFASSNFFLSLNEIMEYIYRVIKEKNKREEIKEKRTKELKIHLFLRYNLLSRIPTTMHKEIQ